MAESNVVKQFTDHSLQLADGAATPATKTGTLYEGNLQITGMTKARKELVKYNVRGARVSVRHTNPTDIKISFNCLFSQFTDATAGEIASFVLGTAPDTGLTSTLGANSEVDTLDATFTIEGTDHGDAADHSITFEDVYFENTGYQGGEPDRWSFEGDVLGDVSGDIDLTAPTA